MASEEADNLCRIRPLPGIFAQQPVDEIGEKPASGGSYRLVVQDGGDRGLWALLPVAAGERRMALKGAVERYSEGP